MKKGNDNFAKNIRILRNSIGLDQAEIAHVIGVNSRTYQKYEYGQTAPSEEKKAKLAELFKVQVSDLYKDDVRAKPVEKPEIEIINRLEAIESKLSPSIDLADYERLKAFEAQLIEHGGADLFETLQSMNRAKAIKVRAVLELPDLRPQRHGTPAIETAPRVSDSKKSAR